MTFKLLQYSTVILSSNEEKITFGILLKEKMKKNFLGKIENKNCYKVVLVDMEFLGFF
jgi:hypothetical protein